MWKKFFYDHDWVITAMTVLILIIGITTIYSTSTNATSQSEFSKQVIFAITGICLYFFLSVIDYTYLRYKPIIIILYSIDIFLLILGFLAGHTVGGATRWLNIGLVNLQPSEITKLILIITLAAILANTFMNERQKLLLSVLAFLPLAVLVFIEPSLSSTITLTVIYLFSLLLASTNIPQRIYMAIGAMLSLNIGATFFMPTILFLPIVKGISIGVVIISILFYIFIAFARHVDIRIITLILCVGISIGFLGKHFIWNHFLQGYQKGRITAFLISDTSSQEFKQLSPKDQEYVSALIYQKDQSRIAIGSGELFGKGFAQGTQSKLNFLPDHTTDFIFASFSEEFGFLGDAILLALFIILYFRIISIAEHIQDPFAFILVIGILTMLVFQTFANIAINTGMLPSTGIPMPLVSYGGSSLTITLASLGIIQNVYTKTKDKKWLNIEM